MKPYVDATTTAIIERQLKRWEVEKALAKTEPLEGARPKPIVTISRAMGARGEEIAAKLSLLTGFQLMDKEILEAIAKDFGVQNKMVELLDEKAQSQMQSWIRGVLDKVIIDTSDYLKSLAKTVGSIMKHGNAILVGRGANIILGPKRGFHLRIIASDEIRIGRIAEDKKISTEKAKSIVKDSDKNRATYIKKSFGVHVDDPTLYDLTLNTDYLDVDDAVEMTMLGFSKKKRSLYK